MDDNLEGSDMEMDGVKEEWDRDPFVDRMLKDQPMTDDDLGRYWVKRPRIGDRHQAQISNFLREQPLWIPNPTELNDEKIDKMNEEIARKQDASADEQRLKQLAKMDNEDALYTLLRHEHKTDQVLERFNDLMIAQPNEKSASWLQEEIDAFEDAIRSVGKDFFLMQKKLPHRKIGELVKFYYIWKKKERAKRVREELRAKQELLEEESHQNMLEERQNGYAASRG